MSVLGADGQAFAAKIVYSAWGMPWMRKQTVNALHVLRLWESHSFCALAALCLTLVRSHVSIHILHID